MTTLLTFLGTGRYESVTYCWGEKAAKPIHLFPIAATELFPVERVVVFLTRQARESDNFKDLHNALGDKLKPVSIPEGRSEAELWEIFGQVADAVGAGETVILDITHAFRSIPLIVFNVAAYLRRTKNVTIEHILYGAFEAREPFRTPPQPEDRVPVFDLAPLLELLDWTSGAEALLKRGDAGLIAEKIIETHQRLWTKGAETLQKPTKLKLLGQKLQNLSKALHLSRPREVMPLSAELVSLLSDAREEFHQWAKPFALIADQIRQELEGFAFGTSDELSRQSLEKQLQLVEYYLQKGLIVQAVALAREWVVNWVALHCKEGDWRDAHFREKKLEATLNAAARRSQGKQEELPPWWNALPLADRCAELWDWLGDLRNDLAHCGMRTKAAGIESISSRAKEIPERLRALLEHAGAHSLRGGRRVLDLSQLYGERARLDELPLYLARARELAGEGNEVVLTGQAPIWLYLAVAHALHGKARRLLYDSPVTGEVCIFDHTPR